MSDDHTAHLLGRLAEAFDRDLPPIPTALTDAAHAALGWRRIDAELAELQFDSASTELVGVRGASTERRSFRFGAGDFVLRVHLTEATLIVMVEPPLSVSCRVVTEDATLDGRTDELGELAVDVPDLPLRLEVDLPNGTTVTPWITG